MKKGLDSGDLTAVANHLLEAIQKTQENLRSVEIWAGALSAFSQPIPEYLPNDTNLLPGGRRTHGVGKPDGHPGTGS